jgi:hypothetical protein
MWALPVRKKTFLLLNQKILQGVMTYELLAL